MPGDDEPAPMLSVEDLQDEADADAGMQSLASNDEWAFRKADRLQAMLPDLRGDLNRKTEGEVFDRQTLMVLHKFLTHGVLRSLDFPVSTGKEANVFRGTTPGGGYVAVKIFRVNTATFKHVLKYIQGDERFEGVTGDKRGLVNAWTQKEFRNLVRMRDVGVDVPEPIKALGNVLVMEYLGTKEGQWPRLKELGQLADPQAAYDKVANDYVKAYNEADLIHADVSEYNILMEGVLGPSPRPRLIDVGQAVLKNHPMAAEFLERDLRNLTSYFRRQGVKSADPQSIRARLQHERHWKKEDKGDGEEDEA